LTIDDIECLPMIGDHLILTAAVPESGNSRMHGGIVCAKQLQGPGHRTARLAPVRTAAPGP